MQLRSSRSSNVVAATFLLSCTLGSFGCRGGGDSGDEGGGSETGDEDAGEDPCTGCSGTVFACFAKHPIIGWDPAPYLEGCAASEVAAATLCQTAFFALGGPSDLGFSEADYQVLGCAALEDPDNCAFWDPASHVFYNPTTGVYEIDQDLIDDIVADPSPLIDCDAGRFDLLEVAPGYVLTDVNRNELSDVLGLQNGDIPVELNSLSLNDMDDVLAAFGQLYYQNETEFTLEIMRGNTPLILEYEIVP